MTAPPTGALTTEGPSMNTRRNMLIGIVVGILIVGDYDEGERLIQKLLAERES